MTRVDPDFPYDMFKYIHSPVRKGDIETFNFLERFMLGPQRLWEDKIHSKILKLSELIDPAKTPQPRLLKDHVGFTKELDKVIEGVTDDDLRKIISLAVALWKKKGLEVGYEDIIRVFTGANVRIFNWFDFRYIVGEQQFGEQQLGEDSWFISEVGVLGSEDTVNNVVALYPFEGNTSDRSKLRNCGSITGKFTYFANGPTQGSERYIQLGTAGVVVGSEIEELPLRGYMKVQHNEQYDFSESFTIETFIKVAVDQDILAVPNDGYVFSKIDGNKEISIQYKTSTNQIVTTLNDGTNSTSFTLDSGFTISDDVFRHITLVVNRDDDTARLWLNGIEATAVADISTIGDLTNSGDIFINARDITQGFIYAAYDNFRISLNQVYDTSVATIFPLPSIAFTEYQEFQLDEFFSDARVQDDGTGSLNRTLLKRIINLMRPVSERINVVYVRLADDFRQGKGNFLTLSGSSVVNSDVELVMQENTFEIVDVVGADDFTDVYFQASIRLTEEGMTGGVVFNWQDANNYYYFKFTTVPRFFDLVKVVSGVETLLAPSVAADIEKNTTYILTVTAFKDEFSSDVKIICYQDRNIIFTLNDDSYSKGRFGFKSEAGSILISGEVEMFEHPLETEQILPGFSE